MGGTQSTDAGQPSKLSAPLPSLRWELQSRPKGLVKIDDFRLIEEVHAQPTPCAHVVSNTWRKSPHASRYTVSRHTRLTLHRVPHTPQAIDCSQLEDGEVVVQCEMLSVDAFLRTMLDEEAYHGAIKLGDTLPALGYGRVIASANPKFKIGKRVSGMLGARSVARLNLEQSAGLFPFLSLPRVKPTTMMGLLGITSGLTAHVGIHSVTKPPRRGQTVLVSGASGATGSVAAQLAKLTGAKVVGVAGGVRKAAYLLDELKLDGAVDYKDGATTLGAQLDRLVRRVPRSSPRCPRPLTTCPCIPSAQCPDGIDFYFDTVGGELLDEVLKRIRKNGRVVVCGASSQYNGNLNKGLVRGPSEYLKLAERGAQMIGYNVMFYLHRVPLAMLHILWLMFRKKLFMTEQIESGIRSFAPAMVKMFTGGHIGKLLVDVSTDSEAVKTKAA